MLKFKQKVLPEGGCFRDFVATLTSRQRLSYYEWLETEMDFVGRFENIQEDWQKLCELVGSDLELPHTNHSKRQEGYMDYFDKDSRQLVEKVHGTDLEIFDYQF